MYCDVVKFLQSFCLMNTLVYEHGIKAFKIG